MENYPKRTQNHGASAYIYIYISVPVGVPVFLRLAARICIYDMRARVGVCMCVCVCHRSAYLGKNCHWKIARSWQSGVAVRCGSTQNPVMPVFARLARPTVCTPMMATTFSSLKSHWKSPESTLHNSVKLMISFVPMGGPPRPFYQHNGFLIVHRRLRLFCCGQGKFLRGDSHEICRKITAETGSELMVIWKGWFEAAPCREILATPLPALSPRILGTRFTNYGLWMFWGELMVIWKRWFETVPCRANLKHPIFSPLYKNSRNTVYKLRFASLRRNWREKAKRWKVSARGSQQPGSESPLFQLLIPWLITDNLYGVASYMRAFLHTLDQSTWEVCKRPSVMKCLLTEIIATWSFQNESGRFLLQYINLDLCNGSTCWPGPFAGMCQGFG